MRMSGGHSLADGSTAATPYDVPSGNIGNESLPAGRKDGPTVGRVKKCPVDTFLVRGIIHSLMNASGTAVGIRLYFVAEKYTRRNIYSVHE